MLDQTTQDVVKAAITEFVRGNQMFTHFDVTAQVRHATGVRVAHYGPDGVQDYVSYLVGTQDAVLSGYCRDLHDFGKGPAFVYHTIGSDVTEYDPAKLQLGQTPTTPASTDPNTDPTQGGNANPFDGKVGLDKSGRLDVRTKMLRQIGVQPGNTVVVYPVGPEMHVEPYTPNAVHLGLVGVRTYKVTKKGNFCIRRGILARQFNGNRFSLTVNGNKIVIHN